MKLIIGMALAVALMLAGLLLEGGHLQSITQLTAFLLVFFPALGMTLLAHSPSAITAAYKGALTGKRADSDVFHRIGRNFLNAGLVGSLLGLVGVVRNLLAPELIGPGVAMSTISILYGFLGYLFFGLCFDARNLGHKKDNRIQTRKLLLPILLAILGLVGGTALESQGHLEQIINPASMLVILGGLIAVAAFLKGFDARHLSYLANGALASGIVGCIFNLIHVYENLDRPEFLFEGFSIALLPVLYSVLIAAMLKAMEKKDNLNKHPSLWPYYLGGLGLLFGSPALVIYTLGDTITR